MRVILGPWRTLTAGVWAALLASPASAAPKPEDPVAVSTAFLESRLVRPVGSPASNFRVVVDVPPAASPRDARPTVAESCGDGDVDNIARDYVKEILRKSRPLSEQNRDHELRFPLRLKAVAISTGGVPVREELQRKPREGFFTPLPGYPPGIRQRRVTGLCRVKVIFPAAGGHPREVVLTESSGDRDLDAFSVQWALLTWQAAPHPTDQTEVKTMQYVLR